MNNGKCFIFLLIRTFKAIKIINYSNIRLRCWTISLVVDFDDASPSLGPGDPAFLPRCGLVGTREAVTRLEGLSDFLGDAALELDADEV